MLFGNVSVLLPHLIRVGVLSGSTTWTTTAGRAILHLVSDCLAIRGPVGPAQSGTWLEFLATAQGNPGALVCQCAHEKLRSLGVGDEHVLFGDWCDVTLTALDTDPTQARVRQVAAVRTQLLGAPTWCLDPRMRGEVDAVCERAVGWLAAAVTSPLWYADRVTMAVEGARRWHQLREEATDPTARTWAVARALRLTQCSPQTLDALPQVPIGRAPTPSQARDLLGLGTWVLACADGVAYGDLVGAGDHYDLRTQSVATENDPDLVLLRVPTAMLLRETMVPECAVLPAQPNTPTDPHLEDPWANQAATLSRLDLVADAVRLVQGRAGRVSPEDASAAVRGLAAALI